MTSSTTEIPQNLEAEESLIGAMLLSPDSRRAAVVSGLGCTDFYKPELSAIFEGILGADAAGQGVDRVTVAAHCNGAGVTTSRLAALEAATPASANAEAYAALVLEASRRRREIGLAHELDQAARNGTDTAGIISEIAAVRPAAGPSRMIDGRTFIAEVPAGVPAVWGTDDRVLWAESESLMIVGPAGVGKTTLAVQLVAGRLGLRDRVLDLPVAPAERVLYLACDRPAQIRRALHRLIGTGHDELLADRLRVWRGPPPQDFAKHPGALLALARDAHADCVVIDSLKDVALGLSDDETGAGLNAAIQTALAEGVDVVAMHHQRKAQNGARPRALEDVYGSTWITAGVGSVVLLWGAAGDPIVELIHLKQPGEPVGPLKLDTDHDTGITTVLRGQADPYTMLHNAPNGLTARDVARARTEKTDPSENDLRVARRVLDKLVNRGRAHRVEPVLGGREGTMPARYFAVVADPEGGA